MHHFLRRLTEISAIALLSVVAGWAQSSQPAAGGTAAPEAKKKNYKDQQEYTLYDSATKETDPNKRLQTLNTWKEKYAESDFKEERLMLFLDTYQKLGQYAKMVDTAKEVLAVDPKELHALYWITLLTPQLNLNSADGLDAGEKAAKGLTAAEAPAGTTPEDWEKAKRVTDAIAYKTLGWVAWQRKNYDEAERNFQESLKREHNSGEVDYWLGAVVLAEKKPERMSEALFHFARAAAYDGPGAMTPQQRQQADQYLTKVYGQLQVSTPTLADLKTLAKANPTPPADFKIKTKAEADAERDAAEAKSNPQLALWKSIKGSLLGPDGQSYFDSSMKGAALPGGANGVTKFKGWLVKANPPVKSKELMVSMAGKDQPADVTLKLVGADGTTAAPLAGKPEVGGEIEFEGVPQSFSKDPSFMVTFDVEKSKITGLKEEKVAAPVHHKKS